jgi:hypothetical protein
MDTPLIDANPTHYLKRVDRDTPALQFVRELVQNGIEAQATSITIKALELELPTESGDVTTVEKFMVVDDGEGMTPEKMFNNLSQMNSSSKSSNSDFHDNFGIGAKITTAMWNPYGVVFCSWHKEDPDNGHLVWLHYNKDYNQICLKGIDITVKTIDDYGNVDYDYESLTTIVNGRAENIIPLDGDAYKICDNIKFNELRPSVGHGTVVILLGNSMGDNTWTDSNKNPLTNRSLRYYLNTRYANIPDTVVIKESGRRAGRIKGFNESLNSIEENFVLSRDIVKCPNGFKVEVILTKDHGEWYKEYKVKRGTTGNASIVNDNFMLSDFSKGFVALQYETKYKTKEFYNIERGAKVLYQWGVNAKSLVGRVKIIVHPPQYTKGSPGVYPNEGRYRLQWKDDSCSNTSNEIDLTEIKEHFVNNQPKSLRELINKAYADYEAKGVDVDKILKRYKPLKTIKKTALLEEYVFNEKGEIIFEVAEREKREKRGNKGTHSRGTGGPVRNAHGIGTTAKGTIRKKKALKPFTIRWLLYNKDCEKNKTDAFEENGYVYPIFIEEFNDCYILNLMRNHEEFMGVIDHFFKKKKTMTVGVVEGVVREQFVGYFITYIYHLDSTKVLNKQKYLSKEALHAKMVGETLLWDRISNALSFVGK